MRNKPGDVDSNWLLTKYQVWGLKLSVPGWVEIHVILPVRRDEVQRDGCLSFHNKDPQSNYIDFLMNRIPYTISTKPKLRLRGGEHHVFKHLNYVVLENKLLGDMLNTQARNVDSQIVSQQWRHAACKRKRNTN